MARRLALVLFAALTAACMPMGAGAGAGPAQFAPAQQAARDSAAWSVKTRDHIDLWLHGFASLQADSARVPYFRAGYLDEVRAFRTARGSESALDRNRERLVARLSQHSRLVNSQFLAIYFANWKEMKQFMEMFFVAEGDPRRTNNPQIRQALAIIAGYFPGPADREWARLFVQSLDDDYQKYYRDYWSAEQERRKPAFAAADSLWRNVYYPKFRRYLDGSQQRRGDLLLSIPIGGEGRLLPGSATSPGGNYSYMAVNYPAAPGDAAELLYVFAHEASGKVVNVAVSDHTTPAQAREGLAERYETDGLVIGGYLLIKRVMPELADDYARFYLKTARVPVNGDPIETQLMAAFPLPQLIRDSIAKQIDAVMAGI